MLARPANLITKEDILDILTPIAQRGALAYSDNVRAYLRAARLGHLLKQPEEEVNRLVVRATQLEDSPAVCKVALELIGEFSSAVERLSWLDSAVLEAGNRGERLDFARRGVEAAEELGRMGAARRWAESASREDVASSSRIIGDFFSTALAIDILCF